MSSKSNGLTAVPSAVAGPSSECGSSDPLVSVVVVTSTECGSSDPLVSVVAVTLY